MKIQHSLRCYTQEISMSKTDNRYTISETAKISGLPESTLRYYETIGLIHPITRDASSKHRVYSEKDVNLVIAMACLNATGMSIEEMRLYIKNSNLGAQRAENQITLLENQKKRLAEEADHLELRQEYVDAKIAYWNAIAKNDTAQIEATSKKAYAIAKELKLPSRLQR